MLQCSRWRKWQSIDTGYDHPKHLNAKEHELRYIIHATLCNCVLRFHSVRSAGFIIFTTYLVRVKTLKKKFKFLYINSGYDGKGTFRHCLQASHSIRIQKAWSSSWIWKVYRSQPLQTHSNLINITCTHMRKKHQQEDQSVHRSQAREKNAVVLRQNRLQQT